MDLAKYIVNDVIKFLGKVALGGVFVLSVLMVNFIYNNQADFLVPQWFLYPFYFLLIIMTFYFVGDGLNKKPTDIKSVKSR